MHTRTELAQVARTYRHGQPIPRIDYSPEEVCMCVVGLSSHGWCVCRLFCVCVALGGGWDSFHDEPTNRTDHPLNPKSNQPHNTQVATWGAVFARQEELLERFACKEYLDILPLMKRHCGYARDNIPQQEDIAAFLQVGFGLGGGGFGGGMGGTHNRPTVMIFPSIRPMDPPNT